MKKITLLVCMMLLKVTIEAQTIKTVYLKSEYDVKEVNESKAKYKETTTTYDDGTVVVELVKIKTSEMVETHSLKGEEQVGVWIDKREYGGPVRDFNFQLIYADSTCTSTAFPEKMNYFNDNAELNYLAPKLEGGVQIFNFIAKHLRYPQYAKEVGIAGKIYLNFKISPLGEVKDIVIKKGVHVQLDKEAVRILRLLKFVSPPMVNNEPVEICLDFPLKFTLE